MLVINPLDSQSNTLAGQALNGVGGAPLLVSTSQVPMPSSAAALPQAGTGRLCLCIHSAAAPAPARLWIGVAATPSCARLPTPAGSTCAATPGGWGWHGWVAGRVGGGRPYMHCPKSRPQRLPGPDCERSGARRARVARFWQGRVVVYALASLADVRLFVCLHTPTSLHPIALPTLHPTRPPARTPLTGTIQGRQSKRAGSGVGPARQGALPH